MNTNFSSENTAVADSAAITQAMGCSFMESIWSLEFLPTNVRPARTSPATRPATDSTGGIVGHYEILI